MGVGVVTINQRAIDIQNNPMYVLCHLFIQPFEMLSSASHFSASPKTLAAFVPAALAVAEFRAEHWAVRLSVGI